MKTALLTAIGNLISTERDIPTCRPGEVLIKTGACGVCRTDLKCFTQGQRDLLLPRVLGHEISGTVAAIGDGVTQVSLGDRVQVAPGIPCGTCAYCLKGQDNLCDAIRIMGFHLDGGFAEYVLIPASGVKFGVLQVIPPHLSLAEACLTEPLACSVNMQNSLRLTPEDTLLIIGAGPLGIMNAKLARSRGVGRIILAEMNEKRLEMAKGYDYDDLIDVSKTDLLKETACITGGTGVSAAIPCCPGTDPFRQGLNALAKGGRLGFFSGLTGSAPLGPELNSIHYKELTLKGAYGCSLAHNREALGLIAEDQVTVRDMITCRLPLEELRDGIDRIRNTREVSIVIDYGG